MKVCKYLLIIAGIVCFAGFSNAQKFYTKTLQVEFKSETAVENIEAINNKGNLVIDVSARRVQAAVLIKAFKFEKALMEEHFNENYLESSVYPKAKFSGVIGDEIDWNSDGEYSSTAKGQLTIHGVTQEVVIPISVNIANSNIAVHSDFGVRCEDYKIKIPSVVGENIAETINVSLHAEALSSL